MHRPSNTSRATSRRSLRTWPLWAKITVPVGGLLVLGGIGNALEATESTPKKMTAAEIAVPQTEPVELGTTVAATTVVATTQAPATTAPTTAPTTTKAPTTTEAPTTTTALVTVPPTAAPTAPPQTVAFVEPPPLPVVPSTDPRFDTCKLAKANGYGPYYQGSDPEYGWYRDADSDGIVCE